MHSLINRLLDENEPVLKHIRHLKIEDCTSDSNTFYALSLRFSVLTSMALEKIVDNIKHLQTFRQVLLLIPLRFRTFRISGVVSDEIVGQVWSNIIRKPYCAKCLCYIIGGNSLLLCTLRSAIRQITICSTQIIALNGQLHSYLTILPSGTMWVCK